MEPRRGTVTPCPHYHWHHIPPPVNLQFEIRIRHTKRQKYYRMRAEFSDLRRDPVDFIFDRTAYDRNSEPGIALNDRSCISDEVSREAPSVL